MPNHKVIEATLSLNRQGYDEFFIFTNLIEATLPLNANHKVIEATLPLNRQGYDELYIFT